MKFGGQWRLLKAEAGLSDVRDGIKLDWNCKAFAEVEGSGHSLDQLHENIRLKICGGVAEAISGAGNWFRDFAHAVSCQSLSNSCADANNSRLCLPGAEEALNVAQKSLGGSGSEAGSAIKQIARSLGLEVSQLERMLQGCAAEEDAVIPKDASDSEPMTLRIRGSTGLGVTAQMCLGWVDTTGYRMVGIGSKADAGIAAGGSAFAGRHVSGIGLKIVLGIGNFTFFYHFPNAVVTHQPRNGSAREVVKTSGSTKQNLSDGDPAPPS
jgi:hypothetical protein